MFIKYLLGFGGLFLVSNAVSANMVQPNLLKQCAGAIPERIALSIISHESSYNPLAIGVNKGAKVSFKKPKTKSEAVYVAKQLINAGYNIDMGYAQINSANLKGLKLSVDQVFDPCTNLKAMQYIFGDCYSRASGENRIQKALSCYNTGNHRSGFANGYVRKVTAKYNALSSGSGFKKAVVNLPRDSDNLAIYANSVVNSDFDNNENLEHNAIANKNLIVENQREIKRESSDNKVANTGDIFTNSKNDIFY